MEEKVNAWEDFAIDIIICYFVFTLRIFIYKYLGIGILKMYFLKIWFISNKKSVKLKLPNIFKYLFLHFKCTLIFLL